MTTGASSRCRTGGVGEVRMWVEREDGGGDENSDDTVRTIPARVVMSFVCI